MSERIVLQPVGSLVLVPVQGPVTPELVDELRESLLAHLEKAGTTGVVFDLSGVEVMDSADLASLRAVVKTVSLMGAQVLLAEVQPGVAAALASLDADVSWIRAERTVERALERLKTA